MDDDIPLFFNLPAVARTKVTAAFDGGRITSVGGVMLLAHAERCLGIADQLAAMIHDSTAIADYLEEHYPTSRPSLTAKPAGRSRAS